MSSTIAESSQQQKSYYNSLVNVEVEVANDYNVEKGLYCDDRGIVYIFVENTLDRRELLKRSIEILRYNELLD